jgi:hypothetical protein
MTFLNPTYLWALLGIAVPIAIHLWSKKEGRTIRIGSIQLLRESDPKQTSNLKLNEIWLLLLRILTIITIVLILAEPELKREGENISITYLIEPSLLSYDELQSITDTLAENGAVMKLLQPGFPEYHKENFEFTSAEIPNYWQLAYDMQKLETDSIVVFTNAFQSGIKGKRPQISKNINWVIIDPGTSSEAVVYATKSGNNVELLSVQGEAENMSFEKQILPFSSEGLVLNEQKDSVTMTRSGNEFKMSLQIADSLSVLIYYEEGFSAEMKYINASFAALSKYLERPIGVTTTQEKENFNPENFSALVWLSESPIEEIESSGNSEKPLLVFQTDSLVKSVITRGPHKNEFQLNARLNAENVLEQHLPEQLFSMLNLRPGLQEKMQQYDRRVIDREQLLPVQTAGISGNGFSETTDFSQYLWMFLLALLLAERSLAYYRKQ